MISKIINTLQFLDSNIVQEFLRNTAEDDLVSMLAFTDKCLKYRIYIECSTRLIVDLIYKINDVTCESEPINLPNTIQDLETVLIKVSGKSASELIVMHNDPANWYKKDEKMLLYQQKLRDLQPQIDSTIAAMAEQKQISKNARENLKKELKIAEENGTEAEFWDNL